MAKTATSNTTFRDLMRIIFTHKSVIVYTFIGVTALALGLSLITPAKYEAATKIMAKERKVDSPLQAKFYSDYRTERVAFLQSQSEIIQSDEVARRVMRKLYPGKKDLTPKQIASFRERIKVLSPKGFDITSSDILFLQITDSNPVKAAEASNLLTSEYINYTYELKGKTAKQTVDFLEKQTGAQLEKMKEAAEQVKQYEGKAGGDLAFLIATVKSKGGNTDLLSYNNNFLTAKMALKETETYLNQLRNYVNKGIPPQKMVKENAVLMAMKENIAKLESQLANLQSQYTDIYPRSIMIKKEIERNKQLFNKEVKADLEGRFVDMAALEARVKAYKETVDQYTSLAQKQLDYSRIYRNYEVLEEGYQELLRDTQKASLTAAMDTHKLASIEIIDPAVVPKSPVSPNIIANTFIGALIGLLLGLGLTFVLDSMDHTVKTVEDIERYFNMPVLGTIPRY